MLQVGDHSRPLGQSSRVVADISGMASRLFGKATEIAGVASRDLSTGPTRVIRVQTRSGSRGSAVGVREKKLARLCDVRLSARGARRSPPCGDRAYAVQ